MRDSLRKYLAAATLLVLPIIAACGEDVMPPPPTGSIVGQVSIEGMGIDGVTVSLSNGASTATAGGGNYRFDTVDQGSYTVTISGFPADASFDATSAPASIGDTGGTVTVDFRGTYIRTAAIMGDGNGREHGPRRGHCQALWHGRR
ncbi:MAG: carboxypeptidase-like regulatory domain-containing protein [Gemmatimonadota bacterium]|nr:carboxypeptidase-like regulatory domain-containing protein [Gemmatimonadota bacterium]